MSNLAYLQDWRARHNLQSPITDAMRIKNAVGNRVRDRFSHLTAVQGQIVADAQREYEGGMQMDKAITTAFAVFVPNDYTGRLPLSFIPLK